MKERVVVLGNWKANKTVGAAKIWIDQFKKSVQGFSPHITIILCPGYHHLYLFPEAVLSLQLGVQDLSQFVEGACTGEIAASMLKDIGVSYALLGHSERRTKFGETDEIVAKKVEMAMKEGIKPIVCVSDLNQVKYLHDHVSGYEQSGMILYEPLSAIGSGQADSPENANGFAQKIKEIMRVPVLYGGSVKPENVGAFVIQPFLEGVGVGGASLDPVSFISLIQNAST